MKKEAIVISFEGQFSKKAVFFEMVNYAYINVLVNQEGEVTVIFDDIEKPEKVVAILLGFFNEESNVDKVLSKIMKTKINLERVRFILNAQSGYVTSDSSKEDILNNIYRVREVNVS